MESSQKRSNVLVNVDRGLIEYAHKNPIQPEELEDEEHKPKSPRSFLVVIGLGSMLAGAAAYCKSFFGRW